MTLSDKGMKQTNLSAAPWPARRCRLMPALAKPRSLAPVLGGPAVELMHDTGY